MKRIFIITIALITLVTAAFPQDTTKRCSIAGYVMDNDPNGLNVRATPNKNGRILSRLKKGDGDISLDIIGSSGDGWVKITNAWHGEDGAIKGTGWVFASMLATGTKGYPSYDGPSKLYSSPSKKSKVLSEINGEAEVIVVDCDGKWAKVRYNTTVGWLAPENQCGSPFTNCN